MDTLKTAVASVADLLDRQFELLNDEKYNMGLGMCCHACTPMTVFSRSTACHNQDKVSMGATAARQAREVVDLTQRVAAIHLLILCQAADLRGPDKLGEGSRRIYAAIRKVSPFVDLDRELRADIEAVVGIIRSGELVAAIEADA